MPKVADDDFALWQAFKKGNMDAFQAIYFHHFHHLYDYGMRLARDSELVKDCIHDLFVKLWSNKANLGAVTAVRSYLLVSLRTTIYNKLEHSSHKRVTDLEGDLPFHMTFSVESDFIKKETSSVQAQQLVEALNQLTPRQKEVIYLRYFEELEYEEIATAMNITVKATYKLSARGLEALRQIMGVSGFSLLILILLVKSKVS